MKNLKNLTTGCLMLLASALFAQHTYSEKITDKWPYLYQEFQKGLLYFDGSKISKGSFNIDVANQAIVFFEDDKIVKSVNASVVIDSLVLESTRFCKIDAVYEVLSQQGNKKLLKKIRIDLNTAGDTGGGYGTGSSTDATTKLTSVDVANYTGVPYEVMKLEIGKGKVFETITGFYLVGGAGEEPQRVSKKSFTDVFPNADLKTIMKENATKLNKQEDLILLFNKCCK